MNTWERYAEDAIKRHPRIAPTLRRLADLEGMTAVGEACVMVYTARDEGLILPLSVADQQARQEALAALDKAVTRALGAPRDRLHDDALVAWLARGPALVRAAAKAPRGSRLQRRSNLGLDSRSLVRAFVRLGATKREAEAIVAKLTPPPNGALSYTAV